MDASSLKVTGCTVGSNLINGPGRDFLFHAIENAYTKRNTHVFFKTGNETDYVITRGENTFRRVALSENEDFLCRVVSLQYEDGSGQSFNLELLPLLPEGHPLQDLRCTAYYNTSSKTGHITFTTGNHYQ